MPGSTQGNRMLLEIDIIQLKENFKSERSHNLFKTVRNLGKSQEKSNPYM